MDLEQAEIRREIESTRADLADKISTLESRVGGAIEEVKRLGDIKYQADRRPWVIVGLSTVTGYIISRMIFARRQREPVIWRHRKIAAGSFVGGIISSVAIALARDLAANLMKKWDTSRSGRAESSLREGDRRMH
jgi:hypothetical protein